jgi:hypothetical protein
MRSVSDVVSAGSGYDSTAGLSLATGRLSPRLRVESGQPRGDRVRYQKRVVLR